MSIVSAAVNLATRGFLSNEGVIIGVSGRLLEDTGAIPIKIINRLTELQILNTFNEYTVLGLQLDFTSVLQEVNDINVVSSIGSQLDFTTTLQKIVDLNTTMINNSLFL